VALSLDTVDRSCCRGIRLKPSGRAPLFCSNQMTHYDSHRDDPGTIAIILEEAEREKARESWQDDSADPIVEISEFWDDQLDALAAEFRDLFEPLTDEQIKQVVVAGCVRHAVTYRFDELISSINRKKGGAR